MSVNPKLVNPLMDRLVQAFLSLKTGEEMYGFLEDLCTIAELHSLSTRLEVARRLSEGDKYEEIESVTGASSATISRVKRSLEYGADGYKTVLPRLSEMEMES